MTEEEDPRPSLLPDPLPPHLEKVLKEKKFYHRNELLACGARGPKAEEPKTKQEKDKQKKSDEKIYIKHVEKGIKRAVERLAGGGARRWVLLIRDSKRFLPQVYCRPEA